MTGVQTCALPIYFKWPRALHGLNTSKNNKERLFKWRGKKNRSFDVSCIVKWCVKCYKVGFLDTKC